MHSVFPGATSGHLQSGKVQFCAICLASAAASKRRCVRVCLSVICTSGLVGRRFVGVPVLQVFVHQIERSGGGPVDVIRPERLPECP